MTVQFDTTITTVEFYDVGAAPAFETTTTTVSFGETSTPGPHAASHASGGSDELTLATAQVTGLDAALAAKAAINLSFANRVPKTTEWIPSGVVFSGLGTSTIVAEIVYWWPIHMIAGFTMTDLAIEITGAASTNVAAGLWTDNSDHEPTTRIADLGTIDASGTGIKTYTGLSVAVPEGVCWIGLLALTPGQNPTIRTFTGSMGRVPLTSTPGAAALGGAGYFLDGQTSLPGNVTATRSKVHSVATPFAWLKRS